MSKVVVVPKNRDNLDVLLNMDVDVVLLSISKLSVNSEYYISIYELEELLPIIRNKGKKVFISLNKIMHNSDLNMLQDVLISLDKLGVDGVVFYDYSVISIKERLNLDIKLIISREHSNASIYSNLFYKDCGIDTSLITCDITLDEVIDIKDHASINIIVPVYGCIPVMYSRRYLLSNYFSYINKDNTCDYYYIKDTSGSYIIKEEEFGTCIYNKSVLDLDYEVSIYKDKFDYILMYSEFIEEDEYIKSVNHYIDIINNKDVSFNDGYKGFSYIKTVFKVKSDG